MAMPPPSSTLPVKDTRPLRDKQYQTKMRQEIHGWLQSTEYDISMQTLMNITGKDFRGIFQYLVAMLDPFYPFDPKTKFEDDFLAALKSLRYPFVGQLDPKWLAAPASMHSWPSLLGVLHWLVIMCKVRLLLLSPASSTYHTACRGDCSTWKAETRRCSILRTYPRSSTTSTTTTPLPLTTMKKPTKYFSLAPTSSRSSSTDSKNDMVSTPEYWPANRTLFSDSQEERAHRDGSGGAEGVACEGQSGAG